MCWSSKNSQRILRTRIWSLIRQRYETAPLIRSIYWKIIQLVVQNEARNMIEWWISKFVAGNMKSVAPTQCTQMIIQIWFRIKNGNSWKNRRGRLLDQYSGDGGVRLPGTLRILTFNRNKKTVETELDCNTDVSRLPEIQHKLANLH